MRTSIAAFALFQRAAAGGGVEYLAQWNDGWSAFNFVGGHKRDGETFRDCCIREVFEELHLVEGRDVRIAAEARARLHYVRWSEKAKVDTEYTIELFDAELLGAGGAAVAADPHNRWLTKSELAAGRCRDGQAISPTFAHVLALAGLRSASPGAKNGPGSAEVRT